MNREEYSRLAVESLPPGGYLASDRGSAANFARRIFVGLLGVCAVMTGAVLAAVPAVAAPAAAAPTTVVVPGKADPTALFADAGGYVASNRSAGQTVLLKNIKTDRTGTLQEYSNGRWVDRQKLVWKKRTGRADSTTAAVATPRTTSTVTRTYRLVINATAGEQVWRSATAVLRHENPRSYTGYRKAVYDLMKGYCPDVVIVQEHNTRSYVYAHSLKVNVGVRPAGPLRRYAALHECAHVLQFSLYRQDQEVLAAKLNAVYRTNGSQGIEQAADCMAFRMGIAPRDISGTYTKDCSGARGAAAARLLNGQRL
jgi:hypothetical protein